MTEDISILCNLWNYGMRELKKINRIIKFREEFCPRTETYEANTIMYLAIQTALTEDIKTIEVKLSENR